MPGFDQQPPLRYLVQPIQSSRWLCGSIGPGRYWGLLDGESLDFKFRFLYRVKYLAAVPVPLQSD